MGVLDWFRKRPAVAGDIPAIPVETRSRNGGIAQRMYANARASRLTSGWATTNGSADTELVSSLTQLRSRARALIRDSSYAKRARELVCNNVVGTGIGMQAQVKASRGKLSKRINDDIERAWKEWSRGDCCHTGGRLSFLMMERQAIGQVFEAGEVFFRKHFRKFGDSSVPYALELIEPERVADEHVSSHLAMREGVEVRMGVEVDEFHRPVAYWIRTRHPSEFRFATSVADQMERIPADQIIHLAVLDRWPQSRGVPWLHTAATRLADMEGYTEAEITRARIQAAPPWAIETPEAASSFGETQTDGSVVAEIQPGVFLRLNPGEKLNATPMNSPNPALDPFMRYMIRDVAAGAMVSYESLSRDYSQSNYSSSRLALLDDRDGWRFLQAWFICEFRQVVHREWLGRAVMGGAIKSISLEQFADDPEKFYAVRFKPRGWSWIDPTKEVEAFKEAIKAGLTTRTDVIAATAGGQDIEDIDETREKELADAKEKGLSFDTDPEAYAPEEQPKAAPPEPDEDEEKPAPSRLFVARR